jgi:hypothetical protein
VLLSGTLHNITAAHSATVMNTAQHHSSLRLVVQELKASELAMMSSDMSGWVPCEVFNNTMVGYHWRAHH